MTTTRSRGSRPPIPTQREKWSPSDWNWWSPSVGISGRLRLESLVAFERKTQDGIPLAWRNAAPDLLAPWLFFSPMLRDAQSTSDLDEVHDARDFTAEA